jgi:hypothetical protein
MQLTGKDKHRLKVKGWQKIFQANGAPKQAEVAIKICQRRQKGHFILIKGIILLEDITIVNMYVLNIGIPISQSKHYWS